MVLIRNLIKQISTRKIHRKSAEAVRFPDKSTCGIPEVQGLATI